MQRRSGAGHDQEIEEGAVETEAKSVRILYGSDLNNAAAMAVLLPVINSV